MHLRSNRTPRRGAFVVFLAACLIMLVAMLALAIDLGVMMVARNQCQNAADIASLAGARRLTGDYTIDYNKDEALPAAQAAATQNNILQRPIDAGQVSITVGSYGYNQTTQQFEIFPDTRYSDNDGWSLVRATVVNSSPSYFARVFGTSTLDVQAVATATHRPRDVALVVDFSGSMRLGSVLGAPITGMSGGSLQIVNRTMSMNADVFPRYGHYTSMISSMTGQGAQTTPTGEMIDRANLTIEAPGDTAGVYLCNNFFQDSDIRDYTQPAFTRSSSSDTSPNGDVDPGRYSVAHHLGLTAAPTTPQQPPPLTPTLPGGTPQARPSGIPTYWPPTSVYIFPNTPPVTAYTRHTWENTGYSNFQGFTEGPSFWGKTFWIWPPDPRFNTGSPLSIAADNGHNDWRKRFFIQVFLGRTTTTSNRGPQPSGGGGGGGRGGGRGCRGGGTAPPPPPPPPPTLAEKTAGLLTVAPLGTPQFTPAMALGQQTPLDDNNIFWDTNGNQRLPGSSTVALEVYSLRTPWPLPSLTTNPVQFVQRFDRWTYLINYDAILYWIKNTGPNPFPNRLQSGGILYYDAIPDTINTTVWPYPTTTQAQRNQRFWKEYIDEVLGLQQTGRTNVTISNAFNPATGTTQNFTINLPQYTNVTARTGFGADATYNNNSQGHRQYIYPRPDYNMVMPPLSQMAYMDYRDNPRRPRSSFWFGPMMMMDFIGNMSMNRHWMPGTAYEAPMWQCKMGVQAAIRDTMNNHPNDQITLIAFSRPSGRGPEASGGAPGSGAFQSGYYNVARSPLGRNYNQMIDSIWWPTRFYDQADPQYQQATHVYETANDLVPRAVSGTCYAMGLMMAYNQFAIGSSDSVLRTYSQLPSVYGIAGGLGRRGAQKVVVFETDGACLSAAYTQLSDIFEANGSYNSYFKVRNRNINQGQSNSANEFPNYVVGGPVPPPTGVDTLPMIQAKEVAQVLCNPDTDPSYPGFSLIRKPALIHCMAFGSLFDPANSGSTAVNFRNNALGLLQYMEYIGNVQESPTTPLPAYKRIYGDGPTKIAMMRQAFTRILQDGYSVSLIE